MEDLLDCFTLKDLRSVCKKLDLSASGLKSEVIERIIQHSPISTDSTSGTGLTAKFLRFSLLRSFKRNFENSTSNMSTESIESSELTEPKSIVSTSSTLTLGVSKAVSLWSKLKPWAQCLRRTICSSLGCIGGVYALIQLYYSQFDEHYEIRVQRSFIR